MKASARRGPRRRRTWPRRGTTARVRGLHPTRPPVSFFALFSSLRAAALLHPLSSPHEIRRVLVVSRAGQHEVLHRVRPAACAVDDMMKLNPIRRAADATFGIRPLE